MHARVSVNKRIVEASKARVGAVTGATLHGRGVFTTLALYGGGPFLWAAHWARLTEHARRAGVECAWSEEEAREALARLVEANKVREGRARLTLLARAARGPWRSEGRTEARAEVEKGEGRASDLIVMTGEARRPAAEGDTLALTVSPHRANTLSPLAGIKSVNYLEHVLAWEEARGRDFDEAAVLNERGEVVSATMANLFWVRAGTLHTPALATGALAGTTRARVLELAGELAVPHVEGASPLHDLADADEIFLTSSALGVALVTAFDFHRYTVGAGSIALRLREAFRQLTLT